MKKSSGFTDIKNRWAKIANKLIILNVRQNSFLLFLLHFATSVLAQDPWKYNGPEVMKEQVKGMIKAVWCDERNPDLVLAGSASGGLFKCTNARSTQPVWTCISDSYTLQTFGVSDIVVRSNSSQNEIFISTSSRSAFAEGYGNGILHTVNGGLSWEHIGPGKSSDLLFPLDGLVMNKENENEMIAYGSHLIYLTKDAWQTFIEIDPGLDRKSKDASICDAEFAPFEKGKFYICTRTNNKYEAKVFQCEDYGAKIKDITPSDVKSERAEIATVHDRKFSGKFYLATGWNECYIKYYNGTGFSANLNVQPVYQTFANAYWNFEFAVNQKDTNVMYLSLTETSKSSDGGRTFARLSQYNGLNTHADNRAQVLLRSSEKGKEDELLVGNDGGISLYKETSKSWDNLNGSGLNVNQFWGISVAQSDSLFIAGGTADNGGFLITEKETLNTMSGCGDGYCAQVIDEEGAVIECNTQSVFYYDLRNKSTLGLQVNDQRYDSKRPLCKTDSFVYIGYSDIWKISVSDLKKGKGEFKNFTSIPVITTPNGGIRNASVKSMAIGSLNEGVVAYRDPNWGDPENKGKLFYCKDLKLNKWMDLTDEVVCGNFAVCQWSEISVLEMDNEINGKFYFVSKDIFHQSNSRLFSMQQKKDTAGWIVKEIGFGLPKVGMNDICIDKFSRVMYLACDNGIYFSDLKEDSLVWKKLNQQIGELPGVPVFDMDINYETNTLFAGTFGRGVWSRTLISTRRKKIKISRNTFLNTTVKVDGCFIVEKNRKCTTASKLIITSGSVIEMKKGSQLIFKNKDQIRNEKNEVIDIELFSKRSPTARIIFKE